MRVVRLHHIVLLLLFITLVGCHEVKWAELPKEVLVADSARSFTITGRGPARSAKLPDQRSFFARKDAKDLALFKYDGKKLDRMKFSISDDRIRGDFISGGNYILHLPLGQWAINKYYLICRVKWVHADLTAIKPDIVDRICHRILCPDVPFLADSLLTEFPELLKFPDIFDPKVMSKMELGPPHDRNLPAAVGSFGNICEQCIGRNWGGLVILDCPPQVPNCWVPNGPGPITEGQVENITDLEVVGAINAVAPHPTNQNIIYVGAVNGGIWRSDNAMAAKPNWTPQTDTAPSLAIGALEFDPTDASNKTLCAGTGRFSSYLRWGGARAGLLRTTNGSTWTAIDGGGTLNGLNISGIAPRGSTIVISANDADTPTDRGVWRSTNTGAGWTQISGTAGSGLPTGRAFDLAGDPANPTILYANAGGNGIYRSSDTGATWNQVSNAAMNGQISVGSNVEIAVGTNNNVFVAIVDAGGQLSGIFRSGNGGNTWTAMGTPQTPDGGIHPGGQGALHLSIAADPTNANVVYVGGDRQGLTGWFWPNSIGARDWTGILFRGDASQPAGNRFTPLTHVGTASSSAPHADSRDMDVAVNGVLIEGDDGGVYRRTSPLTTAGDWFSMNGNIQTTEFHSAAWDTNSDIIIGGTQDNDTPLQQTTGGVTWECVFAGDGGVTVVDDTSTPGMSVRYFSSQFLGGFRRQVYNASNVLQSGVQVGLTVLNNGNPLAEQFYTPIKLNNVDATRLIVGGANSVYESMDQGDTLNEIRVGIRVNGFASVPIAYGASGNADMLYVGSGSQVFIRDAAPPAALMASATYPGAGTIMDVAIDPGAANTAFVVDNTSVFHTSDGGSTWNNVTGNLGTLNAGSIRSVVFRSVGGDAVVIGTDTNVFIAKAPGFNNWAQLACGLPVVPVYDLDYDAQDRIFLAATLGRGTWVLDEDK